MSVALEAGLAAKEVVVSTLGVLYAIIGDEVDEGSTQLIHELKKNVPLLQPWHLLLCYDLSTYVWQPQWSLLKRQVDTNIWSISFYLYHDS